MTTVLGLELVGPATRSIWLRSTGRRAEAAAWVDALPGALERLGPAFVKFAQIVGTRQDLLPPRACLALSRLHDQVAPMPVADVKAVLHQELGAGWPDLLIDLDPAAPIGSGTIAGVYRARLRDGTEVAVKVRRPGVEEAIPRDVDLIQGILELAARMPGLRGVPLGAMGQAVGRSVVGQLDLGLEARLLDELGQNLTELEFVKVPRPVPSLSTSRVLVMTYLPSLRGDVGSARLAPGERRRQLAAQTMVAVFDMLFRTGLVHCDLHPGNLRMADEHMVVLDAGLMYRIPDRVRELLALFFLNMGFRNGRACADAVLESAVAVRPGADLEAFRDEMEDLVDRYGGISSRQFNLVTFAGELFAVQRRHGLYASSEFVYPLLALLMVEGSVRTLDPDLDFQKLVRPVVMHAARKRSEPLET